MPPGTTWTVPEGGFFSWVKLPEGLDTTAMLPRAVAGLDRLRSRHGLLRRWAGP